MNELALFAGAGGGILGGHMLGWRTICAVERDAYAAQVLAQRQTDGFLQAFPIWSDVCSFDGGPWRGIVDIVSGGFPCQDISIAGSGAGLEGSRSGLWSQFARIIGDVQPRYAFIENSPRLVVLGLDRVLSDLASLGFDAEWGVLSAADLGAPHERERLWIVAHANGQRDAVRGNGTANAEAMAGRELHAGRGQRDRRAGCAEVTRESASDGGVPNAHGLRELQPQKGEQNERGRIGDVCAQVPDADGNGIQGLVEEPQSSNDRRQVGLHGRARSERVWPAWPAEPDVGRVVDGMAYRMDRVKAIGNGQVSVVAAAAFAVLCERAGWSQ